jgi:hypothetical protein
MSSGMNVCSVEQSQQEIISDDKTVIVPKVTVTPTGKVYHITGEARFADKPAKIPMILQPVDAKVRLAHLGKTMTTKEIYNLPKIASPAQMLAFGTNFQAEQLEDPIVTVWLNALGLGFLNLLVLRSSALSFWNKAFATMAID